MHERMLDKHTIPDVDNIEETLGFCGKRLLRCFEQRLRAHYDLVSELKFPFGNNYGWGYKYSHKKQHLCYVFFEKGAFTVMTQVGDKKVDEMEEMLPELLSRTRRYWEGRYPCGERGGWMHYRILEEAELDDIMKILALRKKPVRQVRPVSELSLEELWKLFPVELEEHYSGYSQWYEQEAEQVRKVLGGHLKRIEHVGSSAVPGLLAKPIVDILVEISDDSDIEEIKSLLVDEGGWIFMGTQEEGRKYSFNKGYTPYGYGLKVYHLHIRCDGNRGEIYFRDYLIEHAEVAGKYEELKCRLLEGFAHDRDGYTQAKTAFVKKYTDIAKEEYRTN